MQIRKRPIMDMQGNIYYLVEMKCDKKHIKQWPCHFEHDFPSQPFFGPLIAFCVRFVTIFFAIICVYARS